MTHADEPRTALELPLNHDIAAFSAQLHRAGTRHRVYERRGVQVLEVLRAEDVDAVRAAYQIWRVGAPGTNPSNGSPARSRLLASTRAACRRSPAVAAVVFLAVVLFPATWPLANDELGALVPLLTIVPLRVVGGAVESGNLVDALARGEIWRLLTPAWLHFSFAHLAFNVAVVVFLGRRVEAALGATAFLCLVLSIAAVSNVAQYLAGSTPLFGGLSGVAYGILGFVVVRGRQRPDEAIWRLPIAFVAVMILTLVVMATGVTAPFGLTIANAAHVAGLCCGAAIALLVHPATSAIR